MIFATDEDKLAALGYSAQFLKNLFPVDCMVAVTDCEKFVAYYPGKKIDIKAQVNDSIANRVLAKAVDSGERIVAVVPREVYGVAFKTIVIPIWDGKRIIGSFSVAYDLTTQEELDEIAQLLAANFEQIAGQTQEMAVSASELTNSQQQVQTVSEEAQESLKHTDEILSLITHVAARTRLLGLNAAIEAARAGEQGRGFAIVAEEIRTLSENTSKSVGQITEILKKTYEGMSAITASIDKTQEIAFNQAASSQEISASMEELAALAQKLLSAARIL